MKAKKGKVRVITGNAATAYGAMLCRPDVATSYPITPMSEVVEQLSTFRADGILNTEMIEVEGENSAMNVVAGASIAGGRAFTATSSWGLAFMYDAVQQTSGFRAPVVMAIANRETPGILAVSGGQQDIISTRDTGWIQVIVEDGQEILDMIIMAFRLAEDCDIQLPVMVNYDGFYLSYLAMAIEIPEREDVDRFLAPLTQRLGRQILSPGEPLGCGTHGIELGFVELRYKHCAAMERAAKKLDEIDKEFGEFFGRSYGGQIEEYRTGDAEVVVVASGGAAGTARVAVDAKRAEGIKVGLVKLRLFRPLGASTSTTPVGVASKGKPTPAKNMPLLMAMHGTSYVATATLSHLEDFVKKLIKAKEKKDEGFVYIHVFAPCVMGWRIDSDSSIQVCRTAVRTNYFPLWEAENGKFRLNHEVANPGPIQDFTKLVRKFAHMKETDLENFQQMVNQRYALIKGLCELSK